MKTRVQGSALAALLLVSIAGAGCGEKAETPEP
jgi:hypothetical protein